MTNEHKADDLIRLFNQAFEHSERTVLVKGGIEPVYLPASNKSEVHRIIFNRDYFRSALHEISHWCLAGRVRRQITDYGYWYEADGRTSEAQARFEAAEIKPQAIEWLLSLSCGIPFEVSLDNLSGDVSPDRVGFTERVTEQGLVYLRNGPPARASILMQTLSCYWYPGKAGRMPDELFATRQAQALVEQEELRRELLCNAIKSA